MLPNRLIQTPSDWIAEAIACRRLSQRSLARSLSVDASRLSRWIRGEEQIPRAYLAELAQHFPPADICYLLRLKDCEDVSDQLQRRLQNLSESLGLGEHLANAILRQVDSLVAQENPQGLPERTDVLLRHLVDAAGAALLVQRVVAVNFQEPLLLPPTVARFRYPMNHFIGTLLDLDAIIPASAREARSVADGRERLLSGLRTVATAKPLRPRWHELARQFSVHVLARHGTALDRERVVESSLSSSTAVDPLLRRISFTGVILGGADAETGDRFLRALQRDRSLGMTNLFFNAFHYGDATFAVDGSLPRPPRMFRHAVPHILRHLEHPDRYGSILDIEAWTLLSLLETAGPKSFLQRSTLCRLRGLLSPDSRLTQQLAPPVSSLFQRRFSRLLKDA